MRGPHLAASWAPGRPSRAPVTAAPESQSSRQSSCCYANLRPPPLFLRPCPTAGCDAHHTGKLRAPGGRVRSDRGTMLTRTGVLLESASFTTPTPHPQALTGCGEANETGLAAVRLAKPSGYLATGTLQRVCTACCCCCTRWPCAGRVLTRAPTVALARFVPMLHARGALAPLLRTKSLQYVAYLATRHPGGRGERARVGTLAPSHPLQPCTAFVGWAVCSGCPCRHPWSWHTPPHGVRSKQTAA